MKIELSKINSNITRSQKILLALYKLADGKIKPIRFEDIAVESFKSFTADFHLKGYPEYPDTGDLIHKPLYSDLKSKGFVTSGNKYFTLTSKGIEFVKQIISRTPSDLSKNNNIKLTADQKKEIERIRESTAFQLFAAGKTQEILDIDFYSYLGVTVRTGKYDFLGRLHTVNDAIESIKIRNNKGYTLLRSCHDFLNEKFKTNIDYFIKGGKK